MSSIKSFILSSQILFISYLLLSVSYVDCNDKNQVQVKESQRSGESMIVSIINNIIKLKDNNLLRCKNFLF